MDLKILSIKNKINYPLEEIIKSTSLSVESTSLNSVPDPLNIQMSDFDVILLLTGLSGDLNVEAFQKISQKNIPIILITSIKNRAAAYKLAEHCLFTEQLTVPLLESTIQLVIQEERNIKLEKVIEEYQSFLIKSKKTYSRDMEQIIQKEKEFFKEYNTTKSELRWLEILFNAVPCGIIIFDSHRSDEIIMNKESLLIFGNTNLEGVQEKSLFYTRNLNFFNFYTVEGKKICAEELPFFKSINGEDVKDLELVVRNQEKGEIPVLINSLPVYDQSGSITASITAISDISLLKSTEKDLINTIKVKNIITEEFNNRILNILQTITSLVTLNELDLHQSHNDEFDMIESKVRLNFINQIHEKLSSYDENKYIDFRKYVEKICRHLLQIHEQQVELNVEGSSKITPDMMLPCGLIIIEIISCRLRSFPDNQKFNLNVTLTAENGKICIKITDNGPAMKISHKEGTDTDKQLKLTNVLLEQLSGIIKIKTNDEKTSFLIEILYLDI